MAEKRTYVVLGQARGGTSMVAGLLRILGVNMGSRLYDPQHPGSEYAHEDRDFADAKTIEEYCAIIERRNAEHDVWGWKDPFIMQKLGRIQDVLRNPYYILVTRDSVAVMKSMANRGNFIGFMGAAKIAEKYANLLRYCAQAKHALVVSYEGALRTPISPVVDMMGFVGRAYSRDTMTQAVEFIKPGYRDITQAQLPRGV